MKRHEDEFTLTISTKWDRADDVGDFPEAEVVKSPEWMSRETIDAIEQDMLASMRRARQMRKVGRAEYMEVR